MSLEPKATQDTLIVTQEMAEAQKEAFRTEYRPLVLVEDINIVSTRTTGRYIRYDGDAALKIKVTYRNYGKMTALKIESGIIAGPIEKEERVKLDLYNRFIQYGIFNKPALRPDKEFTEETDLYANFSNGKRVLAAVTMLFRDELGGVGANSENVYYIIEKDNDNYKIREAKWYEVEHPELEED